jgi:hypothetical protein
LTELQSCTPFDHVDFKRSLQRRGLLFRLMEVRRNRCFRDRLLRVIHLTWTWWAQVVAGSDRDLDSIFFVARLLRFMVGEFLGFIVNVQWIDFDSFILIPHSLYKVCNMFNCVRLKLDAVLGFVDCEITCNCVINCGLIWVGW